MKMLLVLLCLLVGGTASADSSCETCAKVNNPTTKHAKGVEKQVEKLSDAVKAMPLRTTITENEIGMICQMVDHTGSVFDNIINYANKKHFDLSKVYLQIDCPFSRGMNIFRAVLRRRRRNMWRHMRSALGYFYKPAERREILRNALNKKFMGTTFLGKIQVYKRDKSFMEANMEIDKLEYYIKRDFGAEM